MKDIDLLCLLALAEGAVHGYPLLTRVAELGGRAPGPATLYRALWRLEEDGLIEGRELVVPEDDRRRREYELTAHGRMQLQAELERLRALVVRGQALGFVE